MGFAIGIANSIVSGGVAPWSLLGMGARLWDYFPLTLGSVWQDDGMTTPVTADGDPVGAIVGVLGNALTQSSAGAKPTWVAAGINSQPSLAWDGGDSLTLSSPTWTDNGKGAVYIQADETANAGIIWEPVKTTLVSNGFWEYTDGKAYLATLRDVRDDALVGTGLGTAGPQLVSYRSTASQYLVQRNGVAAYTGTADWIAPDSIVLGYQVIGQTGRLVILQDEPTATDHANITTLLGVS